MIMGQETDFRLSLAALCVEKRLQCLARTNSRAIQMANNYNTGNEVNVPTYSVLNHCVNWSE